MLCLGLKANIFGIGLDANGLGLATHKALALANKKAVLSQRNRTMPQLFFLV